jgi:PIN domain nuclease of toxin-antitoxin system
LIKLLLDTHIWLWSVSEPERVSKRVARALRTPENELWLSPISIWELIILSQKGRVELAEGLEAWTTRALRALPLNEAPVTNEVAREVGRLDLPHRDPADHFLVATAKVFDLTLITADEQLMKVAGITVLANR